MFLLVCETKCFASTLFVYFFCLLIMFVFNNLVNFKLNLSSHDFNTRSKNRLHFPSVKLTPVQKGVTYSAIKICNHLPANIQKL